MNDNVLNDCLQDLYEQAPCGYVFSLPDGTLVRVNQTFLIWTGYSRAELLSRRFQELLTVAGKMFFENQYAPLLRMQGAVQEVTFDIVRRDGSRLPVLMNSVLRVDATGSPILVASTIFRAVERRAYEQELLLARTRAEHLAEVVTASSDAIVTCARDGSVRRWNLSAERLFGYTPATFPTLTLRDLLPFEGAAGYERTMRPLWQGEPVHVDTFGVRNDGKRIDVSVGVTPHTDELGAVSSLSAIISDISERRAIERLQQEFLAMASHELRTPLVAIRGYAQLMQRRKAYNEQSLETIVAQTRQLAGLIDDLLLASQIEANRFELRKGELDLVAVARRAATTSVLSDDCDIRVDVPDDPVVILADRQRIEQVFANLLTNAVKYSPDGGTVEVSISKSNGVARVRIRDQGIGIREVDIPHLFERFYRAPDVAQETKGAGLGLYITQRIVEDHGGRVDVESEIGQGSTFTVTLPAAE